MAGAPVGLSKIDHAAEELANTLCGGAYTLDRKNHHSQQHLAGYSGILQPDVYGGYNALYESGRITEAACMAHARRKIALTHFTYIQRKLIELNHS